MKEIPGLPNYGNPDSIRIRIAPIVGGIVPIPPNSAVQCSPIIDSTVKLNTDYCGVQQ